LLGGLHCFFLVRNFNHPPSSAACLIVVSVVCVVVRVPVCPGSTRDICDNI
jgi:hypothetical protein